LSREDFFSGATLRPLNLIPEITCFENTKSEVLELAKPERKDAIDAPRIEDGYRASSIQKMKMELRLETPSTLSDSGDESLLANLSTIRYLLGITFHEFRCCGKPLVKTLMAFIEKRNGRLFIIGSEAPSTGPPPQGAELCNAWCTLVEQSSTRPSKPRPATAVWHLVFLIKE
jgi:hypothetical protein